MNSWVVRHRAQQRAHLRLFCFPYAGGGASIYRAWKEALLPKVDLYSIQLPGRENRIREKPFTRLQPLIGTLAEVLRSCLNIPFAFFGHSMGSLVCFELARELRRQNAPMPLHLFVSGRRAPHLPDREPDVHHLPDAEFIEELRRLNGTPEAVLQNAELMELVLPLLRADFSVCETYVCSEEDPLDCSISAFGGQQDEFTSHDELSGWREHTKSHFKLRMFPGDHFFLQKEPGLLQAINGDLVELLAGNK